MTRVFINGLGAVSSAGWGLPALRAALENGAPLATQAVTRPGWEKPLLARLVPAPLERPAFALHPRLRRASPITQYAMSAMMESLGEDAPHVGTGALRLGIVVSVMAGGVNYTRRFYEETLREPSTASPLIFPETVFNAPASHLAAYLGAENLNYTLVGDDGTYLQGLALAANWLCDDLVDTCVVIGAEEEDWIVADAMRLFDRKAIHSSGAGAIYLGTARRDETLAELECVTDAFSFTGTRSRAESACRMREHLTGGGASELLCLGAGGSSHSDADEKAAWQDWTGARHAPRTILGEAFTASAAWQCIDACDSIHRGKFQAANVSVVGANQQAIGARFTKPGASLKP